MVWGFVIWIVLSVIIGAIGVLIVFWNSKNAKADNMLAVFVLILGGLIYLGYHHYQYEKNGLAYCNNDVTFNTAVWAGNQDTGYQLCHEQYGFWHLTN